MMSPNLKKLFKYLCVQETYVMSISLTFLIKVAIQKTKFMIFKNQFSIANLKSFPKKCFYATSKLNSSKSFPPSLLFFHIHKTSSCT